MGLSFSCIVLGLLVHWLWPVLIIGTEIHQLKWDRFRPNRVLDWNDDYFARGSGCEYCDEYVCLWVCLSVCPRGYLRNHTRDLYQFFVCCYMSVARSSSGMLTIGRIACHQEWVFSPTENALSAGKVSK